MKRTVAALLLAGILAGCSGATTPTPAAPTVATSATPATATPPPTPTAIPTATLTPSPSPSPSPTPATLTIAQAATAYLAIATTFNKAIDAAYKKYGKTLTLKSQKAYWAGLATARAAFIVGLKKIAFPPEVTGKAAALLDANVVLRRRELTASKSTSIADLNANAASADQADVIAVDKAAILREALGLPSNG